MCTVPVDLCIKKLVLPAFVYNQYRESVQPSSAGVGTELRGGDRTEGVGTELRGGDRTEGVGTELN